MRNPRHVTVRPRLGVQVHVDAAHGKVCENLQGGGAVEGLAAHSRVRRWKGKGRFGCELCAVMPRPEHVDVLLEDRGLRRPKWLRLSEAVNS